MLATVAVVVATHDLAKGVLVGVILSGLFFAQKVSRFFGVASDLDGEPVLFMPAGGLPRILRSSSRICCHSKG
jgi:MFS superfamily sulfate permease-like transporter